jgi:hypothetical protein
MRLYATREVGRKVTRWKYNPCTDPKLGIVK